jgi:hypothetical protein
VGFVKYTYITFNEDAPMAIPLSNEIRALLDANFAHLATLMADGSPQSVPIWVGREGDRILICTGEGSLKENMRRLHPECSESESSDRSLPADILLREKPEEDDDDDDEEDEEEHDGGEDEDTDDGYSE